MQWMLSARLFRLSAAAHTSGFMSVSGIATNTVLFHWISRGCDMMANRSTGFVQIAQSAASYEQQGEFELAAAHWDKASVLARNDSNRHWAQERMQFCHNAAVRGWS
ncbi:ANR family transcriptional regulator [Shigella sonnei]|nr:ANR family transcriptional regulator [Shigella sonnei]